MLSSSMVRLPSGAELMISDLVLYGDLSSIYKIKMDMSPITEKINRLTSKLVSELAAKASNWG